MSNPNPGQSDFSQYGGVGSVVRVFALGLSIIAVEVAVHVIAAWQVYKWIWK